MSGHVSTRRVPVVHPEIGRWVPTVLLHGLVLAVSAALCLLVLAPPLWRVVGLTLAVVGTVVPRRVPLWWLLLLLGLSPLGREPSATDVTFYLLLAGVHLLYVLGGLARLVPWEGRMQVGALVQPMRRFVLLQAVVQPVAVGALLVFGGGSGTVPGLSIVAAVVLGVVAVVLARSPGHHDVQS
jgi:hypothetical protein